MDRRYGISVSREREEDPEKKEGRLIGRQAFRAPHPDLPAVKQGGARAADGPDRRAYACYSGKPVILVQAGRIQPLHGAALWAANQGGKKRVATRCRWRRTARSSVSAAVLQLGGLVPDAFPLVESPAFRRYQAVQRRADWSRLGDGAGHHAVANPAALLILPSA
jgi:hypothetical protein